MTRKELAAAMADKFDMTQTRSAEILHWLFDTIDRTAAKDGVVCVGNRRFKKVTRKARTVRNPTTGEPVSIGEKTLIVYRSTVQS